MKKFLLTLSSILMLSSSAEGRDLSETYAIQNVQTGKNIRPFRAGTSDGNPIILYDHWRWKCMTWRFEKVGADTYRLQNLYTSKSFEPTSAAAPMMTLSQQPLRGDASEAWEFIEGPADIYRIRMLGTNLYLTISSTETNSPIILAPLQDSTAQQWRLNRQNPWF